MERLYRALAIAPTTGAYETREAQAVWWRLHNLRAHGLSGTVPCSLSVPAFDIPYRKLGLTHRGAGNWIRVDENQLASTVMRILV